MREFFVHIGDNEIQFWSACGNELLLTIKDQPFYDHIRDDNPFMVQVSEDDFKPYRPSEKEFNEAKENFYIEWFKESEVSND